jgi:sugar phosphate isomerase/epimerase
MHIAFSSLACPGRTVEEIAAYATAFEYEGIEWRLADGELLGPRTADDVWERIAGCGFGAVCLDTSAVFVQPDDAGRAKAVRHTLAMAERAVLIGAPCLRVFGGQIPDGHTCAALLGPTREALAGAAAGLPSGIEVLVETHDAWSRGADVALLAEGIDRVGVLWDIAHTMRSGETPSSTLRHVGMPGLVHIKDASGETLTHLGEGDLRLSDATGALAEAGYTGWISVEWEKLWHPDLDDADLALPKAITHVRHLLSRDEP